MPDTFLTEDSNRPELLTSLANDPLLDKALPGTDPFGLEMPWDVLDAMIQGHSSIDLSLMPVYAEEEAVDLLRGYGFDPDVPEDMAELESYFIEAVNFIEHRFLTRSVDWASFDEPDLPLEKIPLAVKSHRNIIELLLLAAQKDHPHRGWACALLKVIHTLVYIQNSPLYKYHGQASETILSRFRDVITQEPDGTLILQGRTSRRLKLYTFEAKHHKPRESILIKLLCKKENVAENVWDLVGVRLVTYHPAEAILAIDILREQKVILFPNVIPSRSRNTLVDFEHFKDMYQSELTKYKQGLQSVESMFKLFSTEDFVTPEETHSSQNPLSSPKYRSMHITCRHLLKVNGTEAMSASRFAFPYEIQILDKAGYLDSKIGQGAHASYKQRQLFAARKRVLGTLLYPDDTIAVSEQTP